MKKTGDQERPDSMESDSNDSFDIINSTDFTENDDPSHFARFPWLDPRHALYFPPMQPTDANQLSRWDALDKFSVEHWYSYLQEHTFRSDFITLNHEDIKFLTGNGASTYDSERLINSLNSALAHFNNHSAFLRLSSRSPKDSSNLFEEAATLMSNDLAYWSENANTNQQLVSFVVSMLKAMKATSGKKIIDTITGSSRVFSDLLSLLSSPDSTNRTTKIILREWYDIRPDHEFRIFVSRRGRESSIVTAISQYFHFLYFDKTPKNCFNFLDEQSKAACIAAFQDYILKLIDPKVAQFLNFSCDQDNDDSPNCIREYIVDIGLIPIEQCQNRATEDNTIQIGQHTYVLMVIELNPFSPSATGCGLFNWQSDLNMLWGKTASNVPVLGYRTTPRNDFKTVSLLPSGYEQVIESAIAKRAVNDLTKVSRQVDSPSVDNNRFFPQNQSAEQVSTEQAHTVPVKRK